MASRSYVSTGMDLTSDLKYSLAHDLPKRGEADNTTCMPIGEDLFSGSSIKPEEILAQLNRCPDSEQAQLKRLGRSTRKATWDEAVLLFLCGERALYRQRNPDLTDQDIDAIDLSIGSCLAQSTGGNPAGTALYA